jgi:2-keto-4-pentenoate hydratase/2-oxohepta-3-ene-1,7-dioic acid hydratase in catechol pathway
MKGCKMKFPDVPFSLATIRNYELYQVGLIVDGRIWEINTALGIEGNRIQTIFDLLTNWNHWFSVISKAASKLPDQSSMDLDQVEILAPVPVPGKMINAGLNFYDHAKEMGLSIPDDFQPTFFWKGTAGCVIGPSQKIKLSSHLVDWEAELAVIIGRTATDVQEKEIMNYVAGFTCHNDVTDRGLMMMPDGRLDFLGGKSRDTFGPLGPVLVPTEFVKNLESLEIKCLLNDEVMQDFSTSQMVWDTRRILSHLTHIMTLHPGDVVALGTGAGVGWARGISVGPGEMGKIVEHMKSGGGTFLRPGDKIAVDIPGVGYLENEVVDK